MEDLLTTVKDAFHKNEDFYRFEKSVHKQEEVTLHTRQNYDLGRDVPRDQDSIKMLEKQQREDRGFAKELTREHERVHEAFQKSNDGPSL